MLIEKQLAGPYWLAFNRYGQRFTRFWGKVFEKYVDDLLANSCAGTAARFIPDLRDPNNPNRQICDGLVIHGGQIVVIETKASIFTADAKYGGDFTLLAEEIDNKLVRDGDSGQKRAATQLAEAVSALIADPSILPALGVDPTKVSKIYPLAVTLDSIGGTVGISPYLDLAFQESLALDPKHREIVGPLGCVDIEGLEFMTEHFEAESLPRLLHRWQEFNPPLFIPFVAAPLDGIARKVNPWLKRAADNQFRSATRILFPDRDPDVALREVAHEIEKMRRTRR
jgi:hypothetical protein